MSWNTQSQRSNNRGNSHLNRNNSHHHQQHQYSAAASSSTSSSSSAMIMMNKNPIASVAALPQQYAAKGLVRIASPLRQFTSTTNKSVEIIKTIPDFLENRLWDSSDYVIPPLQNSAIFITTNVIVTPNQVQGVCSESSDQLTYYCTTNEDCIKLKRIHPQSEHGTLTGECNTATHYCKIEAWCPPEMDYISPESPVSNMPEIVNMTLLVKNSVLFPYYDVHLRNILPQFTYAKMKDCRWHAKLDPTCPIFRLGTLLEAAKIDNAYSLNNVLTYGAMFALKIKWDCDLDWDTHGENCAPEYTVKRIDLIQQDGKHRLSREQHNVPGRGFNFRHAEHSMEYAEDGVIKYKRTLFKAYGIQLFVHVSGQARKFDTAMLALTLGASLGLISSVSVICDFVLTRVYKHRKQVRQAKREILIFNHEKRRKQKESFALKTTADGEDETGKQEENEKKHDKKQQKQAI